MKKTTISIFKKTLDRLRKLKLTKRDSYDEIINRLINGKNDKTN